MSECGRAALCEIEYVDAELKTHLHAMEDRIATLIATQIQASEERTATRISEVRAEVRSEIRAEIRASEERTTALIAAEIGSVHTDMEHRFARVDERFDSIDARLKLHAGLIQAGARAMARFSAFSENSEERWVDLAERVAEVERKLGNGASGKKGKE